MKQLLSLFLSIIITVSLSAQITKDDYKRAVSFLNSNLNGKKIFNINPIPSFNADSSGFVIAKQSKGGVVFENWSWTSKQPRQVFDQDRLAKLLSDKSDSSVKANELPINNVQVINANTVQFNYGGKRYKLDQNSYTMDTVVSRGNENEVMSPDSNWVAYSENYNLFIRSTRTGEKKQLSFSGFKNFEYGSWYGWADIIEGENGERPKRFNVQWSPDSKWIQTFICDLRSGNKMYLLDWSRDKDYRARLLSYYRASPGDTGMVYMIPAFYQIESGREIVSKKRTTHTIPTSYEWSKRKPGVIYEEELMRGYNELVLKELDLNNDKERLLYRETSKTNIDQFYSELVEDLDMMIILSDRDGWRQVYSVALKDGALKPVTNGKFYVSGISRIDKLKKQVYFTAGGKETGNPYFQHLYRIDVDGKNLVSLSPEPLDHQTFVSSNGKYVVDLISSYNSPTETVLRSASDGKILISICKADVQSLFQMGFRYPEEFSLTGRDGVTPIYGAIFKPSNFDSSKKYPVIDQTYTGPHTNMFPRNFPTMMGRSNQALAELGFIVVTVDGMGTNARSKAFQSVSYKNMGKNLLDHVIAIRSLGQKYSWVDTTRVGIFGHSAGGYDAGHAVLEYPDFYKVAVASSADHDFRMEKDWWPEMYMGWPVDSTYEQVSNITMAPNLKGKLLITHGGIDENVNPSATFKLAEALIKADKEFDMLILPSQRHGYSNKYNDYFLKKRWNYFVENLAGEKPIWDFPVR
jgi:dienelactone hydrolase